MVSSKFFPKSPAVLRVPGLLGKNTWVGVPLLEVGYIFSSLRLRLRAVSGRGEYSGWQGSQDTAWCGRHNKTVAEDPALYCSHFHCKKSTETFL